MAAIPDLKPNHRSALAGDALASGAPAGDEQAGVPDAIPPSQDDATARFPLLELDWP